jgi:hypothetical protein
MHIIGVTVVSSKAEYNHGAQQNGCSWPGVLTLKKTINVPVL